MEKNFEVTVTLTPDDVKRAVVAYILEEMQGGYSASSNDVQINVQSKIEGYGIGEHEVSSLENIMVVLHPQNTINLDDDRR